MPPRTPKACRVRGCPHTTTDSSGYCERHKSEGWKQYKPGQSRHQRGYGSKWDSIRARVLKRDKGLCQLCLRFRDDVVNGFSFTHHTGTQT